MKKLTSLIALAAALGVSFTGQAQIIVNSAGSGTIQFTSQPPLDQWGTFNITGSDTVNTPAGILSAVQASVSAAATVDLLTSTSESPGQQNLAIRTSFNGGYLVTRPTGNLGTALMAKLQNGTAGDFSSIAISYSLRRFATARTETVVAHEVYYSYTGELGSWVNIPELSGGPTTATTVIKSHSLSLPSPWSAGQPFFILWVDDNESGGTDDGWFIDNVSFVPPGAPMSLSLDAPANNTLLAGSTLNPASVAVSATAGGEVPPTSVSFYANNVLFATDTTAPFSVTLTGLLPGSSVSIYAVASNATEFAFSSTNVVTVRDEFVHFTGSALIEVFDGMGANGTETPIGWYVGHSSTTVTPPINLMTVSVGDGSAGPSPAGGWNYGTTGDGDRALGTASTSTGAPSEDRNVVVRIQNNTASSITAINFSYDGESWRNYTNSQFGYTNMISLDNGGTWILTGTSFDYLQPVTVPGPPDGVPGPGALNGNDPANRQASIGGSFTLPSPVAPNGTLYIRWFDRNEGGTDGAVAIDNFIFTATLDVFTPTVTISSPADGSSFAAAAPVTITAVPSMASPVTNVTFYNNNLSTVITNDTTSPFSITVNNLSVGNHTLFVIAQDNSGARATNTATVTITINPNVPPSVTITNPVAPLDDYLVGTNVSVGAEATDSDGSVVGVEFYVNGVRRGTNDTSFPYSMTIGDLTAGLNHISAVAIDNAGGRATNTISLTVTNPPGLTAIVTNGSNWKYLDNGTDQGTAWRDYNFDDAAWQTGLAELGYGDGPTTPESTVIGFGPDGNNKYATTYFRKKFNVADPAAFSSFALHIWKDDHVIVYLNGTQIYTDMTNAVITFATYEQPAIGGNDESTFVISNNIPSSLLRTTNIIAVELHQDGGGSSDIGFDLMLWGESGGPSGPRLTIVQTSPTQATISWGADATGYTLYGGPTVPFSLPAWTSIGSPITGAGSTVVNTTGNQFFILRNP